MTRIARICALAAVVASVLVAGDTARADQCALNAGTMFPGDDVGMDCTIRNLAPVDATFYWFVDPDSIVVESQPGQAVPDGAARDEFLSFFEVSVATDRILTADNPTGPDSGDVDLVTLPDRRTTCDATALTTLDGTAGTCFIGRVRRSDYGRGFDTRGFTVTLHFVDTGSDQSAYAGWGLGFASVFRVRVPAAPECGGSCPPVYER